MNSDTQRILGQSDLVSRFIGHHRKCLVCCQLTFTVHGLLVVRSTGTTVLVRYPSSANDDKQNQALRPLGDHVELNGPRHMTHNISEARLSRQSVALVPTTKCTMTNKKYLQKNRKILALENDAKIKI